MTSRVGLLVASTLVGLAGTACRKSDAATTGPAAPAAEKPVRVTTALIEERPMPLFLTVTGSLRADLETDVAADANGKVLATLVERGQAVKAGEPIATLDTRAAALGEQQARAQARLARETSELAKLECERGKQLFAAGAIPQAEYDRRMTACQVGEAQVGAAQAGEGLAKKQLADATVRAPFAGVIGERFVNPGQVVQPSTRVASLYRVDPLRLVLTVPEADLARVRPGQPVEFRVAAFPDRIFTGAVRYLSPHVRPLSRDLVIEAVVPNKEGLLRPGMFAAARLRTGDAPVAVVPASALRKGEVATSLFVVTQGRAVERIVQTGEARDGLVAVLAGARKGDTLVADPGDKVRDGAPVAE